MAVAMSLCARLIALVSALRALGAAVTVSPSVADGKPKPSGKPDGAPCLAACKSAAPSAALPCPKSNLCRDVTASVARICRVQSEPTLSDVLSRTQSGVAFS